MVCDKPRAVSGDPSVVSAGLRKGDRMRTLRLPLGAFLAALLTSAAIAVYAISATLAAPARKPGAATPATVHHAARLSASALDSPPSASEFAVEVVGTTTAYANANGEKARIANVSCVQASSGHYMCSYAVVRPGRARECHLMQAIWTPNRASTYTVTLAGRTHACGTVREAVRSLD